MTRSSRRCSRRRPRHSRDSCRDLRDPAGAGYITREKKALLATDLGRYLIALIQDRGLKSAELTGEWEAKLREVEDAAAWIPAGSWRRSSGTPVR